MRPRISIRGSVHPSVRPSVHPSFLNRGNRQIWQIGQSDKSYKAVILTNLTNLSAILSQSLTSDESLFERTCFTVFRFHIGLEDMEATISLSPAAAAARPTNPLLFHANNGNIANSAVTPGRGQIMSYLTKMAATPGNPLSVSSSLRLFLRPVSMSVFLSLCVSISSLHSLLFRNRWIDGHGWGRGIWFRASTTSVATRMCHAIAKMEKLRFAVFGEKWGVKEIHIYEVCIRAKTRSKAL